MRAVTDLSSYLYCPRKLYFKKRLKWKEPQNKAMLTGTIVHKAIEDYHKAEEELVTQFFIGIPSEDGFLRAARSFLQAAILRRRADFKTLRIRPSEIIQEAQPIINRHVQERFRWYATQAKVQGRSSADLWESCFPKIKCEIPIKNETMQLRGIIDQLEVQEGSLVPVELKTGSAPDEGMWDGHRIQMASYAVLLE